jgi:hypothetical protein
MTVEVENKGPVVGYLDPECLCSTTLRSTDNTLAFFVSYMLNAFNLYATKDLMFTSYLSTNHYLDSLKKINTNTGLLKLIINE